MKKYFLILIILGVVFFPASAFLKNGARVKTATSVNAFVESKVSPENSQVSTNVKELVADTSQRVILTIRLHDKDNKPLPSIKVELYSNRGELDDIRAVKIKSGEISVLSSEEQSEEHITQTNENGEAFFRISSTVPGEATLTIIADNVVELPGIKITFLPLPFPRDVSISVDVPTFLNPQGKITLFKSKESAIDKLKLINTGVEVKIPPSLFFALALLVLVSPVMLAAIYILTRKVKKAEEKELRYLEMEKRFLETLDKVNKKAQPPPLTKITHLVYDLTLSLILNFRDNNNIFFKRQFKNCFFIYALFKIPPRDYPKSFFVIGFN